MGWAGAGSVATCGESALGPSWGVPCGVPCGESALGPSWVVPRGALLPLCQRALVTGVSGELCREQCGWALRAVSASGHVTLKRLLCVGNPLKENNIYILSQTSVQFSRSVVSHSLWPHGLQHSRSPCPSPTPRVCSNSCPLSWWRHPTISSSVTPFSCLPSFPASESFPMSWLFASGGQSIGASASVLPMNIQDPLGFFFFLRDTSFYFQVFQGTQSIWETKKRLL